MVFRRKRYLKKRVYRKRKNYIPKAYKRFVKNTLAKRVEYKYHTAYYVPSSIPNNGLITNLVDIPQGVLDTERIGDQIRLATITFRYVVTVGDSFNFLRLIIFQFKANNSLNPGVSAILNGTSPTYLSQYSVDNNQIFQILYDRTHRLDTDDPAKVVIGKCNMKYCKRKLQFQAGSNTIGTGMIYALAISDSAQAPHPGIIGEFNFWYSDS